jgi:RHS repeat-associated protein
MKEQAHAMKTLLAAFVFASIIGPQVSASDAPRFRPASAVEPVIGHYRVVLSESTGPAATAADLARVYGARIEPVAAGSVQGVTMVMRPAQARTLSADRRVSSVEELSGDTLDPAPSTVSPSSLHAQWSPRSEWSATQTLWESGTYEYDGAGNIRKIGADIYRYDGVGRLTFATAGTAAPVAPSVIPANEETFEYDRYGNLTSLSMKTATVKARTGKDAFVYSFAVDAKTNRLGLTCTTLTDGCVTGVYDPATGNQLGVTTPGEYIWDATGMMTELRTGGHERYIYDANDERILINDGPTSVQRYFLRNSAKKVAREITFEPQSNKWTLVKDYVYRGDTLMASYSGAETVPNRHYHVDHLGSTRLVTDGAGYRLAVHTYRPFGPEAEGSDTDNERLKFTGHERDSSSGLDYMHARYYNSNAGRFLSVDPVLGEASRPQTWNRYSYVENNPVTMSDPTGKCPWCVGGLVGGIVGVAIAGVHEVHLGLHQGVTWKGSAQRISAAFAGGAVSGAVGTLCATCPVYARFGGSIAGNALGGALSRAISGKQQSLAAVQNDVIGGAAGFVLGEAGGTVAETLARSKIDKLTMAAAVQRTEAAQQNLGLVAGQCQVCNEAIKGIKSEVKAVGVATGETTSNLTSSSLPEKPAKKDVTGEEARSH